MKGITESGDPVSSSAPASEMTAAPKSTNLKKRDEKRVIKQLVIDTKRTSPAKR